jgi:predicted PurR-regulated permease PerM
MPPNLASRYSVIASYLLIALFLLLVLKNGLLGALFAGLLMFSLIHAIAPALGRHISDARARVVAAAAIGAVIVALLGLATWGLVVLLRLDSYSITHLYVRLADIIDASRDQIPPWISEHLPVDAHALREAVTRWLREHAGAAQAAGAEVGKTFTRILLGMVIGLMASLHDASEDGSPERPFTGALEQRARLLAHAFRNIVFAQVWISGINTVITAIFIFIVLPLAGVHLPLSKTVVAITFLAGLLPVIGNLISNTVLVVVSLSHSLHVAVAGLVFMIVVHKLEYFLNARIIGSHINARAWELLAAMLFAEAVFGIPGVIAAPVFYAYIKDELRARELI